MIFSIDAFRRGTEDISADPHSGTGGYALLAQSDLLVLPSLWPEPFALVGLEAARHRLPVAAYAVGGIPDWLTSGENGYLAPGDPPTVDGLVPVGSRRGDIGPLHIELLLGAFADVVAIRPTTD